jgi:hypothetical protein
MAQFPIYTTRGDWGGMLIDANIYSPRGEWIGWLTKDGQVFSVVGKYVGWLSKDFRILRKKVLDRPVAPCQPPAQPPLKVRLPVSAPLPPLMADLPFDTYDVLDDDEERLHTLDDDPDAKDMD